MKMTLGLVAVDASDARVTQAEVQAAAKAKQRAKNLIYLWYIVRGTLNIAKHLPRTQELGYIKLPFAGCLLAPIAVMSPPTTQGRLAKNVNRSSAASHVNSNQLPSSFRDPSGFLFREGNTVYRQVNSAYKDNYDLLIGSGLYDALTSRGRLIPHTEVDRPVDGDAYRLLEPEQLRYVSYPYEWSFSQLRDAALLTLDIQSEAMKHGMCLKDASAYNVQFHRGRPLFIDTLSFEKYQEGDPWAAYRQFCQHFLGPLALICYCDHRLHRLLRSFVDGIPLSLTSNLLPRKTWLKFSLLAHLHLHARAQNRYEDAGRKHTRALSPNVSRTRLEGLLTSLRRAIEALNWKYALTEWGEYYQDTNYSNESMQHKSELVSRMLSGLETGESPTAADFGANTGRFSRLAADAGYFVLSHDIDEVAVDKNYREMIARTEHSILPLVQDLTNPSPAIGWGNEERMSFVQRHDVDLGMALALIHHIAISNNVPLESAASFFSKLCRYLIIEFVPKSDSQVERLLATREDIFPDYSQEGFERAFSGNFTIISAEKIKDSERTLYLMRKKDSRTA